jgi:hypothetical protein
MLNEYPEALLTHKDIYNKKKQFRYKTLDPYTPTQALLAEFERYRVQYTPIYDGQQRLYGLYFTYPWYE